jgi:putative hydrolase of the HAD superfamily
VQPATAPKALLFDLGGVLVNVDFNRSLSAWARYSRLPMDALKAAFRFDTHYERHERGEITSDEYFAHLASTLQLSASPAEIAEGWNALFLGVIPETLAWVDRARRSLPCYVLTNTNAAHMACWTRLYPTLVARFDRVFTSFQIGRRKPEREAFLHVCEATGLAPRSILFFDDSPLNVRGAAAAGLQGVFVSGPADVARSLQAVGVSR